MSPENHSLTSKDIHQAEKLGGSDVLEDGELQPEDSLYADKADHWQRSVHHSPNHLDWGKKNGRNHIQVVEKPFEMKDWLHNFIRRYRNSRKQR